MFEHRSDLPEVLDRVLEMALQRRACVLVLPGLEQLEDSEALRALLAVAPPVIRRAV
jgi:hypothetical protein